MNAQTERLEWVTETTVNGNDRRVLCLTRLQLDKGSIVALSTGRLSCQFPLNDFVNI